jgi:hypothetical protein
MGGAQIICGVETRSLVCRTASGRHPGPASARFWAPLASSGPWIAYGQNYMLLHNLPEAFAVAWAHRSCGTWTLASPAPHLGYCAFMAAHLPSNMGLPSLVVTLMFLMTYLH